MNTIFWLAIFVAVCGIGRFVLSLLGLVLTKYFGSGKEYLVVNHYGITQFLPWMWLFGGIAGLIVAYTL